MATRSVARDESFPHFWQVEILEEAPLISPGRHYIYPQAVEEVERGALILFVRSHPGIAPVMTTFALGFADPALPHGIWSCPNPRQLCAVAGGYAYILDTAAPEKWSQVPYRPVVNVQPTLENDLLIFTGFHKLWALGKEGQAWETGRLSWEGIRLTGIDGSTLHGFGWDLATDSEVAFTVDLATGHHTGGASPAL